MDDERNPTYKKVFIMTTTTKNVFVTPIQAAKELGKQPQVIYGWIRTGKLDDTILKYDGLSNKPFVHLENLTAWMATRPVRTASTAKPTVKQNPNELLHMMITWFEEAGQTKLADDLKKVFEKHSAEQNNESDQEVKPA